MDCKCKCECATSGAAGEHSRRARQLAAWSSGAGDCLECATCEPRAQDELFSSSFRDKTDKAQRRDEDDESSSDDIEISTSKVKQFDAGTPPARRRRRKRRPTSSLQMRLLFPACVSLLLYLAVSSSSSRNKRQHSTSSNNNNGGEEEFELLSEATSHFYQVHAFNLDAPSALVHVGPENSYFGFSVSQHRDRGVNHLLVGAPKASTDQPRTKAAGAVYKCSPSYARACQQIPFDPTGPSTISALGEKLQVDDKSHQWFGFSLQSATENGSFVACAPAYVYFSTSLKVRRRDPVGTCWVSRGSFTGFLEYSPCRLNDQWGHHHLGSCQAGFASAITKDGGRLFMAAPGSHVWQGQVFMHNLRTDLTNSTSAVNPHQEDDSYLGYSLALGKFSSQSASANAAPSDSNLAIGIPRGNDLAGKVMLVDRDMRTLRNLTGEQVGAYFGYSLAVLDVNGDGLDDLIVGAPNYYNASTSHKEPHFDRGRVYVALQNQRHELNIVQRLDGHKNRARFGTALANCGDLNRDGLQDLAVGAPHDGPEGHGAVYIYMGRKGLNGGVSHHYDQVIYAESVGREGHLLRAFGFSLSAGLDIDGNQYPDLLVGDYKADRAVLLRARPVVTATTSMSFQPEFFNLDERLCLLPNSSLSVSCITVQYCTKYTGVNVDQKLGFVYNISLDSEYSSKNNGAAPRLFLLHNEGRSDERVTSTLTKDVQQCRTFKAYINRTIRDKLTPFKIDIDYELAANENNAMLDPSVDLTSARLRPVLNKAQPPPATSDESSQEQQQIIKSQQMSKLAMVQRNCGPDNICVPDLRLTMTPSADSYLIGSKEKLSLEVTVRNLAEDAFESMFYLTMPTDVNYNINKSREANYPECDPPRPDEQLGENVLICRLGNPQTRNDVVKFSVIITPANTQQQQQLTSFSSNRLNNQADLTFAAHVNSTNPEQDEKHREDNQVQVGIPIRVEFQLTLSGNSQPPGWVYNSNSSVFAAASTSSNAPVTRTSLLPVSYSLTGSGAESTTQVTVPTQQITRSGRMSEADVGPEIYHTYQLQNKGPSAINDIALTILWPAKTRDGADHLLYLVDEPETSAKVRCKPAPEDAVNPLGLRYLRGQANSTSASNDASYLRNKRQAANEQQELNRKPEAAAQLQTSTVDESVLQQLYLASCGPNQCTRFECNVNNLAANEIASIKIRSRLFEETLAKLSLQEFSISSKLIAQIKSLPFNVSTSQMPPYSYKVETQVLTTGLAVQDLLPWWLIVLAILLGILLFALLACFLKYLGFFARKRPPKAQTAEREPLTPTIWNDYQYSPGDTAL